MNFLNWLNKDKKNVNALDYSINIKEKNIPIKIVFSSRKSIAIQISGVDGSITVRAAHGANIDDILTFVNSKSLWIENKLSQIATRADNIVKREYIDGSKHLFLGKEYTLKVFKDGIKPTIIDSDEIHLHITTKGNVKKYLNIWYKNQAMTIMPSIITPIIVDFHNKYSRSPSSIEYKFVSSYWGVCTSDLIIRLNIELIRAKREHVEYIISHELCHLVHPNHSKSFYNLLDQFRPSWKQEKKSLNELVSIKY